MTHEPSEVDQGANQDDVTLDAPGVPDTDDQAQQRDDLRQRMWEIIRRADELEAQAHRAAAARPPDDGEPVTQ